MTRKIGSSYQSIKPIVKAIGERYEDRYLLMYSGDYRNYANDSADNRNNHFSCSMVNGASAACTGSRWTLMRRWVTKNAVRTRPKVLPEQFKEFGINKPIGTRFSTASYATAMVPRRDAAKLKSRCCISSCAFATSKALKPPATTLTTTCTTEWNENSPVAELFDQKAKTLRYRYSFITNQRRYELNPLKDSNEYYLLFGMKTDCRAKPRLMVTLRCTKTLSITRTHRVSTV